MRIKDCLKALLAFVLVLSTLQTVACSKKTSTGSQSSNNFVNNSEDASGDCTHADTILQNAKAATCISEGYSGDRICKACGILLEKGKFLGLTDHMWDGGVITKYPSCVSTGNKTVTCKTCFITETQIVELSPCNNEYHFEANEAHRLVCGVCYRSESGEHKMSELVERVEASCLEDGYELYYCADCKSNFKVYDSSKPAVGHNWNLENPIIAYATCSAEGSQYFVCKNQGCSAKTEEIVLKIAPGAHSYKLEGSYEPTCTSEGLEKYLCEGCGLEKEVILAKLPHNYSEVITEGDWTYKTCACGHKLSSFDASSKEGASVSTSKINFGEAFAIDLKNATIEFPSSVVSSIKNCETVSVNAGLVVAEVREELLSSESMSDEDKAVLSDPSSKIYDFGVNTDNSYMHAFGEEVRVTVPYTLGENEDPEGIVIWYVAANGELEAIEPIAFYDEDGDRRGEVSFSVDHFSYYAVAYKETPEMKCRRGLHDYSNKSLWRTVEASCDFHGYTVKECKTCGAVALDSFTDKKAHELGAKITPVPDCEKGGYIHQKCNNCSYVKNHEYIPAKGHTMTRFTTCEVAGTCDDCHRILVAAYGHDFSEWMIITDATDTNEGLKRRNCPICGIVEDLRIPQKSSVIPMSFTSYSDLLEAMVREALNMEDGRLEFNLSDGESEYAYGITVNKTEGTYLAHIKADIKRGDKLAKYSVYYKNGRVVLDGEEGIRALNIDECAMLLPDFEQMYSYASEIFEYYDSYLSPAFEMAGRLLDEYIEVYGEGVNDKLKEKGSEYTVEDIKNALDSTHALYAYFAYKMGITPVSGMPAEVEVPEKKDIHKILSVFMDSSVSGENTTYTYDFESYKEMMDDLIKLAEDESQKTLDQALYSVAGDAITAHFPSLTDWNKLLSHLKTEYRGSVKVKEVIDGLISFVESSEACTAEEFYRILGAAVAVITKENIDIKGYVDQYSGMTLDEFINELSDGEMNAADFYGELDRYMTVTLLGDVVITSRTTGSYTDGVYVEEREDITLADHIADMKEELSSIVIEGKAKVTLNEDGELVALDVTEKVGDKDNDSDLSFFSVNVSKNAEKIEVPEDVKPYIDIAVETQYDKNGNLIIMGLPENSELDASLTGKIDMTLADKLVRDPILSEEYGIDVFVLDQKYWTETVFVGEYPIDADGKLYEFHSDSYERADILRKVKYKELVSDPISYLPESDASAVACFVNENGEDVALYSCVGGLCYKQDGRWMLVTHKSYDGCEDGVDHYSSVHGMPYDEVFKSAVISNMSEGDYYGRYFDAEGKEYVVLGLYIEGDSFGNVEIPVTLINGEIYVAELGESGQCDDHRIDYYVGEIATNTPSYDVISKRSGEEHGFYKNGKPVEGYEIAELYAKVPSYYAEYDGHYFSMSSYDGFSSVPTYSMPFVKADVKGLDVHRLPDGRPVFVVGRSGNISREGTVYGFIPVNGTYYVQAACQYKNGELVSVLYRASAIASDECAGRYHSANIGDIIEVEKYVTYDSSGKVTLSAEALEIINENCNGFGNFVSLDILASVDGGKAQVGISHTLAISLAEEFAPELISGQRVEWIQWFNTDGDDSSSNEFTVNRKDDGSLEIVLSDGRAIDIGFQFDMSRIDPMDALTYSASQSEDCGFDVYSSAEYSRNRAEYVLYNGKYYRSRNICLVRNYTKATPSEILKANWYLDDIDCQLDEVDENGNVTDRIYRSDMVFRDSAYTAAYATVYLKIREGKIFVLTGVSNASDITLTYDSEVALDIFINGLELVEKDSYETEEYYYKEGEKLFKTDFEIKYGAETVAEISYSYYTDNGSKQYIYPEGGYKQIIFPDLEAPAALPVGAVQTAWRDLASDGMKYSVVDISYSSVNTEYYAKVADKLVNLSHMGRYSTENMLENIAERSYIVGVNTPDGWKFYENYSYSPDGLVPLSPISLSSDEAVFRSHFIGTDERGYAIFQFNLYDMNEIDIHTVDGTEVYCRKGSVNECYAKLGDNVYTRGYLTSKESGFSFTPEYWQKGEFDTALAGALHLHRYLSFNGSSATVTEDALKALEKYSDRVSLIVMKYNEYGYSETVAKVNFSELQSMLED